MNDSDRLRSALYSIAGLSHPSISARDIAEKMSRIAYAALLQDCQSSPEEIVDLLILKLKKTSMTITEKLQQWNPQHLSFDELLELRAGARALRAEYSAHCMDPPHWLTKAESSLDEEIGSQGERKKLQSMTGPRETLQAVKGTGSR